MRSWTSSGSTPPRELRELEQAILRQDPALDLETAAGPVHATPPRADRTSCRLRSDAGCTCGAEDRHGPPCASVGAIRTRRRVGPRGSQALADPRLRRGRGCRRVSRRDDRNDRRRFRDRRLRPPGRPRRRPASSHTSSRRDSAPPGRRRWSRADHGPDRREHRPGVHRRRPDATPSSRDRRAAHDVGPACFGGRTGRDPARRRDAQVPSGVGARSLSLPDGRSRPRAATLARRVRAGGRRQLVPAVHGARDGRSRKIAAHPGLSRRHRRARTHRSWPLSPVRGRHHVLALARSSQGSRRAGRHGDRRGEPGTARGAHRRRAARPSSSLSVSTELSRHGRRKHGSRGRLRRGAQVPGGRRAPARARRRVRRHPLGRDDVPRPGRASRGVVCAEHRSCSSAWRGRSSSRLGRPGQAAS